MAQSYHRLAIHVEVASYSKAMPSGNWAKIIAATRVIKAVAYYFLVQTTANIAETSYLAS